MNSLIVIVGVMVTISYAFGAATTNIKNNALEGFTYLGDCVEKDVNGLETRISYQLSNDRMDQNDAIAECRFLGGKLLSILTQAQDETIRFETSQLNEHVWTSGRYDSSIGNYNWVSVNRPFIYKNWVKDSGHPANTSPTATQGVTISSGGLSAYGWCINSGASNIRNGYRYICQF